MPENQTAWNSDNQGIEGTIDQTNQTGKTGGWREPEARQQTEQAGLTEQETETQSSLWTTVGVAAVGETPSVTQDSLLESGLETRWRAALFPLWPLPHMQRSKEGCPVLVNT